MLRGLDRRNSMCGIAGFLSRHREHSSEAVLRRMTSGLAHRGPDDAGYWLDSDAGIGLGHRRLAVLDLSPAGRQPMVSASGRFVIAFNGEIYNHIDLREQLPRDDSGARWRGHSDTETLLAGFDKWGIGPTIMRCIGMFAFAVWDRHERMLTLGRDRLGEKPLYYGVQRRGGESGFLFGSELKALRAHPDFESEIDRDALCLLMRHNAIGSPCSIYKGVRKLPPGHLLQVSNHEREAKIWPYWNGSEIAVQGNAQPLEGSAEQVVHDLEVLLKDAVRRQMTADVPLGAFLSGGVDSSIVVALMQAQSPRPVKTFTISFHEDDYNEAEHAKVVASHLRTDHTELLVSPEQALAVIHRLPILYDEPFSDSSQIPTFLVSQLARQSVTVSLSGDGGDELFCGYNRYQLTSRLWGRLSHVPRALRRLAARGIVRVPPKTWNRCAGFLPWSNVGDKLHKGARVLGSASAEDLYRGLVSHWGDPASVVIGGTEPKTLLTDGVPILSGLNDVQRMMALDMLTYLPDDILTKLDRAAMGVSLETRVPFLDHRVVEFAWRLPMEYKLRDGQTKWALRQVLYRYVPKELIERPKMGFAVPIEHWLRGPLRGWAEALIDESRLRQEGFFHPAPIRQKWLEHLSGQYNWQHHLWTVLMFQAWLETQ